MDKAIKAVQVLFEVSFYRLAENKSFSPKEKLFTVQILASALLAWTRKPKLKCKEKRS